MGNGEKSHLINPFAPGTLAGLLLIGGGILLFLDNLGILPFSATSLFWPLVFVGFGVASLSGSRGSNTTIWGITALVAGILLALGKFHILPVTGKMLWPLALIAVGLTMLLSRMRWQAHFALGSNTDAGGTGDRLQEFAMFSGVKRKVDSPSFEGGELSSVFGGVEIDLRRAGISAPIKEAVIEANAAFGGIEIRVPVTWRVSMQGTAVFGAYEDKTLPPRPEPGIENPLLIVRGGTAFGAVVVQN